MTRRTAAERVRAVEAKRPDPAIAIAGGAEPIPRRLVDLVLDMIRRGKERMKA